MDNTTEMVGARFSPKETTSKIYCCVHGCNSKACNNPDVRFHYFPKSNMNFVKVKNIFGEFDKVDCRKEWQKVLGIEKEIKQYMQVCSLHFKESDYVLPSKKFLKKNAVPSCNLPSSNTKKQLSNPQETDRSIRISKKEKNRRSKNEKNNFPVNCDDPIHAVKFNTLNNFTNSDVFTSDINTLSRPSTSSDTTFSNFTDTIVKKCLIDIGVQAKSDDLIMNYCDVIKTDQELNTITGINNFDLLNTLIDIIELGYPKYELNKRILRSKVIMTFMKFKHNISYAILVILFKQSSKSQCRKVIMSMINMLYNCLKEGIPFPQKENISTNIPECFRDFSDVRIVLNCIEIVIQKPTNLCCRQATYSRYKDTNTIKFMTGITLGGMICFISKMYGGKASNEAIFQQSNILDHLEVSDAIMVDKSFKIKQLCKNKDIKLIRPPLKKEKKQLSKKDALLSAKITKALGHIERSNQRLKVFQILGSRMPMGLVKKGEEIFTIISAVVNMSSSILNND